MSWSIPTLAPDRSPPAAPSSPPRIPPPPPCPATAPAPAPCATLTAPVTPDRTAVPTSPDACPTSPASTGAMSSGIPVASSSSDMAAIQNVMRLSPAPLPPSMSRSMPAPVNRTAAVITGMSRSGTMDSSIRENIEPTLGANDSTHSSGSSDMTSARNSSRTVIVTRPTSVSENSIITFVIPMNTPLPTLSASPSSMPNACSTPVRASSTPSVAPQNALWYTYETRRRGSHGDMACDSRTASRNLRFCPATRAVSASAPSETA